MKKQSFGYIVILLTLLISVAVIERAHARTTFCFLCYFDPTIPAIEGEGHIWWAGGCELVYYGGYPSCTERSDIDEYQRCHNGGEWCEL